MVSATQSADGPCCQRARLAVENIDVQNAKMPLRSHARGYETKYAAMTNITAVAAAQMMDAITRWIGSQKSRLISPVSSKCLRHVCADLSMRGKNLPRG